MAMLQRRFASSVYAVRRTLERMRHRRQRILDDPEAYRQQMLKRARSLTIMTICPKTSSSASSRSWRARSSLLILPLCATRSPT